MARPVRGTAGEAFRMPSLGAWWCLEARFRPRVRAPAPRLSTRCCGAAHGALGGAHAGGWPARGTGES